MEKRDPGVDRKGDSLGVRRLRQELRADRAQVASLERVLRDEDERQDRVEAFYAARG